MTIRGEHLFRTSMRVAQVLACATLLLSCKNQMSTVASLSNIDSIPTQTVENMMAWQIEKGVVTGRLTAPYMAKYSRGTDPYEIFPQTFRVEGYTSDGALESVITANRAVHKTGKGEFWEAYGDVVILNVIKQEKMETDTLYWDRGEGRIFTHCYVRLTSPDFYAQGYGMESDDRASNAKILKPFDSYGYIQQDSTQQVSPSDSTRVKVDSLARTDSLSRQVSDTLALQTIPRDSVSPIFTPDSLSN